MWWCIGNRNYVCFVYRHIFVSGVCECPRWRSSYQWMYDPAVLTGCIYCLHAYPEWMQTPLNLWGPLYNNWGNAFFFHWILQSKMAWMPWNVHYFLLVSYKAYSFTLQRSRFCYLNNKYFNNRCEFSTHIQRVKKWSWVCGVKRKKKKKKKRTLFLCELFLPWSSGPACSPPLWSYFCLHAVQQPGW